MSHILKRFRWRRFVWNNVYCLQWRRFLFEWITVYLLLVGLLLRPLAGMALVLHKACYIYTPACWGSRGVRPTYAPPWEGWCYSFSPSLLISQCSSSIIRNLYPDLQINSSLWEVPLQGPLLHYWTFPLLDAILQSSWSQCLYLFPTVKRKYRTKNGKDSEPM